jgi:hypothetical protein
MSRYSMLRETVAYFAASADDQKAYYWGADDMVNEVPLPLGYMLEKGDITKAEFDIIRPLEELIDRYCERNYKQWEDEDSVLFRDPLWAEIRPVAAAILAQLPDEVRENAPEED